MSAEKKAGQSEKPQSGTTEKALTVIEQLASVEESGYISLLEISKRSGLDKATVYRILNTLLKKNYLEKNGTRYRLSLKLLEVAMNTARNKSLSDFARTHLQILANEIGERAFLSVLDRNEIVQIDKVEGNPDIRVVSEIGNRFPLQCTASGKAFLAFLPKEKSEELIKGVVYKQCTEKTIKNRKELEKELEKVRRDHYAISDGEYRYHERSIATPILRNKSEIIATIGIAGTTMTFTDEKLERIIGHLLYHAQKISTTISLGSK